MSHINIEIKAKCINQDDIRNKLKSLNADFKGIDFQTDTYFKVNNGRLKLREGNIENQLIYYQRENTSGLKQSDVILFNANPNSSLKEILKQSLGILIEVKKRREIYFIENVKFHLDYVESLGHFIEIEAIDLNGS
ncbi:MAG: class IV adenylate cyclase, partial [Ignavibacterium sp.]|nr:class IV adenylate cyclase [Ignavibacterium sp.]MDW8375906.1 class IV adenylate cyclase [Ignavibacteriales bacterium]